MLEPLPGSQWNRATAAHLMNRAGFGGSPQDIENLRQMGLGKAVSWFVDYERIRDDTPAPDWAQPDPGLIARRQAISHAADLTDGDIKYNTDFRSVYASILQDWLKTNSVPILGKQFPTLPIIT